MQLLDFPMQEKGSMPYAHLTIYLQELSNSLLIQDRPLLLLCPGGAYAYTSDREAEPLALRFMAMGYHVAILRYSVAPARYPTALTELARSMLLLRQHAKEWHILQDHIYVSGCSAGGHLAAHLGVTWHTPFLQDQLHILPKDSYLLRPAGLILCYPVITSGSFAHRGSFSNLLGEEGALSPDSVSLEKLVTENVPPTFLWHTFTDPSVPVQNSLLFASALAEHHVSTECHIFAEGGHGLSLANALTESADSHGVQKECEMWIPLVHAWLERQCPAPFVLSSSASD